MKARKQLSALLTPLVLASWTAGCGGSTKARSDGDEDVPEDATPDAGDTITPDVPDDTVVPDATDATGEPDGPAPVCGDGTQDSTEKCDDTNLLNGDGCNPTCDLHGTVATVAGQAGDPGMSNANGSSARFRNPTGIDSDGTSIFVADAGNCVIREVDISSWDVTTLAGTAGTCAHADGAAAEFNVPQDVCVTGGSVYVADTDNHVIRRIDLSSGVTSTFAGTAGSSGSTDDTGTAARFNEPRGITTDGTNLYVADFGNHTIRQIVISSRVVTTIAGQAGSPGSTDDTGSAARFNYPRGLVHHAGELFVTDTDNHTIRRVVISSGAVTTIAGQAGSNALTDGTGSAARFNSPRGIAADAQSLYVADFANHAIRQILVGTWDVSTLCGNGTQGTTDGTGSAARMHGPWGIAFDPTLAQPGQMLYVSELGNHIIRTVD
jgi:cysteine-rich repeat protein